MKKILSLLFVIAVLTMTTVPAFAAAPVDIQQNNINGKELLEKLYELQPGEDPNSVIEEPFEKDGFIFNLETVRFEEVKQTLSKDSVQTISVETQTDDQTDILKRFVSTLPYTDETGYTGTLYIDTGSILTEAEGYETKRYTVTDTKEYSSMMMNDPSGIPQSTTKNGVNLQLSNINWVVTETALAGDSLVPVQYKAVASYSGSYSKQVPTGYVTTVSYKGALTLEVVEKLAVKVTYAGTPIPAPPSPEPEPEPETEPEQEAPRKSPASLLLPLLIIGVVILGGVGAAIVFLRKTQVEIFCQHEDEYKSIAKEPFDTRQPVIDLNGLKDKLLSPELAFELDKKSAERLADQRIAVLLDGKVQQHTVDLSVMEDDVYRFYINLGGNVT